MMELDTTHRDDVEHEAARIERSTVAMASRPAEADIDAQDHNGVFTSLVTGDTDIIGLVAYSIYKQNKYDWLMAFSRHRGRGPNADETFAYLQGEGTPRRLATYRHLAEATLDGRGLEVPALARSAGTGMASSRRPASSEPPSAVQPGRPLLIGTIIAILLVIGLVWYFHGGPISR